MATAHLLVARPDFRELASLNTVSPPILLILAASMLVGCGAVQSSGPSPDALRAYAEAGVLAEQGDIDGAAAAYDRAAESDPDVAETWVAAARMRIKLRQWPEAVQRAERAHLIAPNDALVVGVLGDALLGAERLEDAAALYQGYLTHAHDNAMAWAGLGRIAARRGDLVGAEQALLRAVELAPDKAKFWALLGDIRERTQQPRAAAEAYDRAAILHPRFQARDRHTLLLALQAEALEVAVRVAQRLAGSESRPLAGALAVTTMLIDRGRLDLARSCLSNVLELHPDQPHARLMLAQLYLRSGEYEAGRVQLSKIKPGTATWPEAVRLLGVLALKAGQHSDAIGYFRQARTASPDDVDRVVDLVQSLRLAGRYIDARSELLVATAQWPQDTRLGFSLGLVIQSMEGDQAAINTMQDVLRIDPRHPGALNFIGYVWANEGVHLDEAEAMIRMALKLKPRSAAITDSLGWVLFRQGQLKAAEAELRRAVGLQPDHAEIHFHLGEVLRARGLRKEARRAYRKAMKLAGDDQERAVYRKAAKRVKR